MSVESRRPSTDTRFDSVVIGRESKLNLEALKGRQFQHAPKQQKTERDIFCRLLRAKFQMLKS